MNPVRTLPLPRLATIGITVALALTLSVGPAHAKGKPGNSPAAKLCQKGGWENLMTSAGTPFNSEKECVSYAATGGTLTVKPTHPYAASETTCTDLNGTFTVLNPLGAATSSGNLWSCAVPIINGVIVSHGAILATCEVDANDGQGSAYIESSPNADYTFNTEVCVDSDVF